MLSAKRILTSEAYAVISVEFENEVDFDMVYEGMLERFNSLHVSTDSPLYVIHIHKRAVNYCCSFALWIFDRDALMNNNFKFTTLVFCSFAFPPIE